MSKNLISLITIDRKGYKQSDENDVLKVLKGSLIVTKGDLKPPNFYRLYGTTIML